MRDDEGEGSGDAALLSSAGRQAGSGPNVAALGEALEAPPEIVDLLVSHLHACTAVTARTPAAHAYLVPCLLVRMHGPLHPIISA